MMNFNDFLDNYSILDADLLSINIQAENSQLKIHLIIRLKINIVVRLTFEDIIEYNFYFSNDYYFYIISDYILIKNNDEYYISLDPYDSFNGINSEDMDFIRSEKFNVEILSK